MNLNYESLVAGTSAQNSDSGANVARKFNDNFDKTQTALTQLDESTVKGLTIGSLDQPMTDGVVDVPRATLIKLGVIKSSEEENTVFVREDGVAEVNSLNVNKLVQTNGDYLIIEGNYE